MNTPSQEYKTFLEGLNKIPFDELVLKVKAIFEDKKKYNSTFRRTELFLNENTSQEIINTFDKEYFIKLFYLDSQAKELSNITKNNDIETIKHIVYCLNDNQRLFEKKFKDKRLKEKLESEGFIEQDIFRLNEEQTESIDLTEDLKKLNDKKVICVMDISKIGLLGSFDEKEEIKGTLFYSNGNNALMLIPQRCRTRGHIIRGRFYYKELK